MSTIFNPDDFINKAKQLEADAKKRTLLILATVVLLVLAFIFYSVTSVKKTKEEVVDLTNEKIQITNKLNHEDSAKNVIFDFFKFQNSNDSNGIVSLLSDTIVRYYYIDKPVSIKNIKSNKNFSVNQKGKYMIDSSFQISTKNDTLIANVISPIIDGNKTLGNTFHTIKMNSSFKIMYVRAFTITDKK